MHTHTQEEEEKEEEEEQEQEEEKNNIYSLIIDYLNQKTSKNFKSTSKKTRGYINARLKENFTIDDFQKVIDIKTEEWNNDKKMCNYLRPETLFGNKFESYLNQKKTTKTEYINDFAEYDELSRRYDK